MTKESISSVNNRPVYVNPGARIIRPFCFEIFVSRIRPCLGAGLSQYQDFFFYQNRFFFSIVISIYATILARFVGPFCGHLMASFSFWLRKRSPTPSNKRKAHDLWHRKLKRLLTQKWSQRDRNGTPQSALDDLKMRSKPCWGMHWFSGPWVPAWRPVSSPVPEMLQNRWEVWQNI